MQSGEAVDHLSREARLGAMGVTQWYARVRLPGAAESPVFAFPDREESGAADSHASVAVAELVAATEREESLSGAATALLESVDRSSPPVGSLPASNEPVVDDVVVAAPTQLAKGKVLACHLGLYRCGDYLICSAESTGDWVPKEQSLLKNILFALGVSSADLCFLGEFFWPVFAHAHSPLNTEATFQNVCGAWLAKHQSQHSRLLLFSSPQIQDALVAIEQFEGSILRVPVSLADMLANPSLKSQGWQAMREQFDALGV